MQRVVGRVIVGLAVIAGISTGLSSAFAQSYPSRSIRLIVPYPAGGGTDFYARVLATKLSEQLGQPMLVENRPGAASMIGAEAAAKSPADGYTLLLGDNATFAVNSSLYKKMPYDAIKDFQPITFTIRAALMLAVPGASPYQSVSALIDAAKADPGKLNYGSPGPGTPHHLAMELFMGQSGVRMTHVPYKGGAPAFQDLLAGRLDTMFLDLGTAGPNVRSGKVRALAVGNAQRVPSYPDVRTLDEAGVTGYEVFAWQGLVAPAGTPREIVARLNTEFAKAMADTAMRQKMAEVGFEFSPGTPEQLAAIIQSETTKWAKIIRERNISVE